MQIVRYLGERSTAPCLVSWNDLASVVEIMIFSQFWRRINLSNDVLQSFINRWHYYFSIQLSVYQFITEQYLTDIRLSPHPGEQSGVPIRGQSTTHYWAVPCNLSHSPPGPSRLSDHQLSYPRQLAGWPRQAGRQETHSHNDVMDLDTLLWIKCWANGCIVRYDILVTGHERAVSQQGPRTTQLSFNRELTSNQ